MKQQYPLTCWAAFQPQRPPADFKARPAHEVMGIVLRTQSEDLQRIFLLCRDDPENAEWHRLEAFESCPGLSELWPQPFQAKFRAADGAVLKNIRVSGTAKANGSAAGIAAQAKNTQFLGCVNEAAVTSTGEKAGGIAALLDGASSLTGCTNLGAVTGTDGVGGLAGVVNDKESTTASQRRTDKTKSET